MSTKHWYCYGCGAPLNAPTFEPSFCPACPVGKATPVETTETLTKENMDPKSPFNISVPLIGQPQILNMSAIVLLQCNCEAKTLLMGPVGAIPMGCPACKKMWLVQAEVKLEVRHVVAEDNTIRN